MSRPSSSESHHHAFVIRLSSPLASSSSSSWPQEPVVFVKGLLDMRDKFDRIVTEAFSSEKASQKKLQEAFEDFINVDARCANYMALYVDDLLKK